MIVAVSLNERWGRRQRVVGKWAGRKATAVSGRLGDAGDQSEDGL